MEDIINNNSDGTVQLIFEIAYGDLTYRDALYFTTDEYNSLSQTDIDNLKKTRYDAWISVIDPVNSN